MLRSTHGIMQVDKQQKTRFLFNISGHAGTHMKMMQARPARREEIAEMKNYIINLVQILTIECRQYQAASYNAYVNSS